MTLPNSSIRIVLNIFLLSKTDWWSLKSISFIVVKSSQNITCYSLACLICLLEWVFFKEATEPISFKSLCSRCLVFWTLFFCILCLGFYEALFFLGSCYFEIGFVFVTFENETSLFTLCFRDSSKIYYSSSSETFTDLLFTLDSRDFLYLTTF